MFTVAHLLEKFGESLGLTLVAGGQGLTRKILVPEAHRPGLALTGYLDDYAVKRIVLLGRMEINYLKKLSKTLMEKRIRGILSSVVPAVIIGRGYRPLPQLKEICEKENIPLLSCSSSTMKLTSSLTYLLSTEFAPKVSCHATLVEVFGLGVLIRGDSSVGKSEAALGLIERGHRLVADDLVFIRRLEGEYLEGHGADLSNYHMEVRGVGIINVAHLYGVVCICDRKRISLVVDLENWEDGKNYTRLGLEEDYTKILGVKVPCHTLPVKPGRDVVLILETLALNHRLKKRGYHSAKELQKKLEATISAKTKKRSIK